MANSFRVLFFAAMYAKNVPRSAELRNSGEKRENASLTENDCFSKNGKSVEMLQEM
ncbi:MAG: hypothetical protein J5791_07710 [Fibrobacter sp.]|nr:hypothetical protein [Fibrobacter sp.]